MIKTRKELHAYIEQDLKNNLVQLGGGKKMAVCSCKPKTAFYL